METIEYRYMSLEDLEGVLKIERGSNPHPWTRQDFVDCLERDSYALIQTYKGQISGFAIQTIALDEAHLLNIGVCEELRRRGLGSNLLEKVIFASEAMGSKKIFLEVRVSNAPAIQLYIDFAFKEIGLRKDYYKLPEGREDALLMSKKINRLAF